MAPHETLKAWRTGAGLSQAEASRRLGVSQAAYCDYEAGNKVPRMDKAEDMERITAGAVKLADWVEFVREREADKEARKGSAA